MPINPSDMSNAILIDRIVQAMTPDVEYTQAEVRLLVPDLNPITVAQCLGRAAGEDRLGRIDGGRDLDRYVRA